MTSTSRSRQPGLVGPAGEDLAIVGPVEARQAEARHLDRGWLQPRVFERGADRRVEGLRAASKPTALAFEGPDVPRPRIRKPGSASQASVAVPPPSTPSNIMIVTNN